MNLNINPIPIVTKSLLCMFNYLQMYPQYFQHYFNG